MADEKRLDRISFGEMVRALRRDYDKAHAADEDGNEPSCVIEFELTFDAAVFTPAGDATAGGRDEVGFDFNEPKQTGHAKLVLKPSAPLLARLGAGAKVLEQKRLMLGAAELKAIAEATTSHEKRTEDT